MTHLTTRDIGLSLVRLSDENDKLRTENEALKAQLLKLQTAGLVALAETLNTILNNHVK
jgi:cell division protein FtsB